jgi:hypothetical protein
MGTRAPHARAPRRPAQRGGPSAVHPLPAADSRGLVGFYTAVGWIVAGYLGATFLGIIFGPQPARRHTVRRLGALAALAPLVGFAGAALAVAIGDFGGSLLVLGLVGALTVAAVGTVTVTLQSVLGVIGTGVAILVFVVLGNPSSGGPFPFELLPQPWRAVGPLNPDRRRDQRDPRRRLLPGRVDRAARARDRAVARRRGGRGARARPPPRRAPQAGGRGVARRGGGALSAAQSVQKSGTISASFSWRGPKASSSSPSGPASSARVTPGAMRIESSGPMATTSSSSLMRPLPERTT